MSRGLGKLQREILELAKASESVYAEAYGMELEFASPVVDLRRVLPDLANMHNAYSHCRFVKVDFQASFSRASRSLIERGLFVPVHPADAIRMKRYGRRAQYYRGVHTKRQARFVRFSETSGTAQANRGA